MKREHFPDSSALFLGGGLKHERMRERRRGIQKGTLTSTLGFGRTSRTKVDLLLSLRSRKGSKGGPPRCFTDFFPRKSVMGSLRGRKKGTEEKCEKKSGRDYFLRRKRASSIFPITGKEESSLGTRIFLYVFFSLPLIL